jgi:hypothetical protein
MRAKLSNKSPHKGHFVVEDVDHDDDARLRKAREIAAGSSIEVHVSQRGYLYTFGFDAEVVPLPKRIRKPETPPKQTHKGSADGR